MKKVKLKQRDGTSAPMRTTDIGIDPTDPRPRGKRRRMYYKFVLHISSTDIQVSINSFHTRRRENPLIVAQKEILMTDKGEFESAALQEEYNNIGAGREMYDDPAEEPEDDHHSEQPSIGPSRAVQNPSPHREPRTSPTSSKRRLEESSSANISQPAYAPPVQGMASAARNMLSGDPKRVALVEHTHSHYSSPITREGTENDRGRHAAPQTSESASRASSRYRTRSSTPIRLSDHLQQARKNSVLRESQVCVLILLFN
jgi:hypothetical protein